MECHYWSKRLGSSHRSVFVTLDIILTIVGLAGGAISTVWWFRSWFAGQFSKIYDRMGKIEDNIIAKLEYHERHDDERFLDVHTRIWEIKLQLAGKDLDKDLSKSRTPGTKTPS